MTDDVKAVPSSVQWLTDLSLLALLCVLSKWEPMDVDIAKPRDWSKWVCGSIGTQQLNFLGNCQSKLNFWVVCAQKQAIKRYRFQGCLKSKRGILGNGWRWFGPPAPSPS